MAGKMKMGKKKKASQQPNAAASALMICPTPNCRFSGKTADVEAHVRLACEKSRGKGQIALPERINSGSAKAYVCGECTPAENRSFRMIEDLNQHKAAKHASKAE